MQHVEYDCVVAKGSRLRVGLREALQWSAAQISTDLVRGYPRRQPEATISRERILQVPAAVLRRVLGAPMLVGRNSRWHLRITARKWRASTLDVMFVLLRLRLQRGPEVKWVLNHPNAARSDLKNKFALLTA